MATPELRAGHYLEWNTDLCFEGNESVSPIFRVRGIEHYFKFCSSGTVYKVSLECPNEASRTRFTPFNVTYYAQIKRGSDTYNVYKPFTYSVKLGIFLTIDYSTITAYVGSDIRYRHILRFVFNFDCADKLEILGGKRGKKTVCSIDSKDEKRWTEERKSGDKSVQTPAYLDANFEIQSLSEDLSKLLGDSTNTDVELVCHGRTFSAHRSLLSVRSDVFRAMLGSDMTEGKTGRVQIEDAEPGIFQQFIEYLYRGRLEDLNLDTAVQLYKLGDKYAVGPLKSLCVSYFAENLALDNACSILSLADRHNDEVLKEKVMAYIVEQQIPLQGDKSSWSNFSIEHPLLAVEVMTRLCNLMASSK